MRTALRSYALFLLLGAASLAIISAAHAQNLTSASYQVLAPVVSAGGAYATSSSFSLLGTISEFAHNAGSSASFGITPGFAAYPSVSTPIGTGAGKRGAIQAGRAIGRPQQSYKRSGRWRCRRRVLQHQSHARCHSRGMVHS